MATLSASILLFGLFRLSSADSINTVYQEDVTMINDNSSHWSPDQAQQCEFIFDRISGHISLKSLPINASINGAFVEFFVKNPIDPATIRSYPGRHLQNGDSGVEINWDIPQPNDFAGYKPENKDFGKPIAFAVSCSLFSSSIQIWYTTYIMIRTGENYH